MKTVSRMKFALGLALVGTVGVSAHAQPNVAVSIGINQPGVYGRINIGNLPPPPVVYVQPVVIVPSPGPVAVQRAPIYLYVPATQQQNWSRYCSRYGACGQPVYFVEERWVRERYEHEHARVPVQVQRAHDNGRHRGWDKDQDHDRDDEGRNRGHGKEGKEGKKGKGGKHDD